MTLATENKQPLLKSPKDINFEDYSVLNPQFPPDLYHWMASLCPQQNCAWDVITGQGAVPVALTEYFSQVVGTETSIEKLKTTLTYPRVEHGTLEQIKQMFEPHSIDLITLQSDWQLIDKDWFQDSLKSLTHDGTVLVLWRINPPKISAALEALRQAFIDTLKLDQSAVKNQALNQQWPEWNFPDLNFTPIKSPRCKLIRNWTLQHFIDYLGSLPEVKNYLDSTAQDPRASFIKKISAAWGTNITREVTWTAHCQAYQVETL